jgi:drug/metabolite transporter (DMT)-like permease
MNDSDALARNRFFALSLLRIAGALLIIAGLVIAAGRFERLPPVAGIVMVLVGAVDFALVPLWLARRWRTPK